MQLLDDELMLGVKDYRSEFFKPLIDDNPCRFADVRHVAPHFVDVYRSIFIDNKLTGFMLLEQPASYFDNHHRIMDTNSGGHPDLLDGPYCPSSENQLVDRSPLIVGQFDIHHESFAD